MIPAPQAFPFLSVGILQIAFTAKGKAQERVVGTVYLFSIDDQPNRKVVLGAKHNLSHLKNPNEEVDYVKIYFGSFDCDASERYEGAGYRVALSKKEGTRGDYGVLVLDKEVPASITPIPLQRVVQGLPIDITLAGCIGGNVLNNIFKIYQENVTAGTYAKGVINYPKGTTKEGMSGGPVILGDGAMAKAIGIIGGDGIIGDQEWGLSKCIDDETISDILQLTIDALS